MDNTRLALLIGGGVLAVLAVGTLVAVAVWLATRKKGAEHECTTNGDCGEGKRCVRNRCVGETNDDEFCGRDADCKGDLKACDTDTNECVECTSDRHCRDDPKLPACSTTRQVCVECTADRHCKAPTPYCNVTDQKCVAQRPTRFWKRAYIRFNCGREGEGSDAERRHRSGGCVNAETLNGGLRAYWHKGTERTYTCNRDGATNADWVVDVVSTTGYGSGNALVSLRNVRTNGCLQTASDFHAKTSAAACSGNDGLFVISDVKPPATDEDDATFLRVGTSFRIVSAPQNPHESGAALGFNSMDGNVGSIGFTTNDTTQKEMWIYALRIIQE